MADLLAWAALAPLLAAAGLLAALLAGRPVAESTAIRASAAALAVALLADLRLLALSIAGPVEVSAGPWLHSGGVRVDLALRADPIGAGYAALAAGATLVTVLFSRRYLHREPGLLRAVALMDLFAGGVTLLALASDAVIAFVGWELAGITSALLIAFYAERRAASGAGLRAFTVNRLGDAALLTAIALALAWAGTGDLAALPGRLEAGEAAWIAGLVLVAGGAKAGLLPFSSWVERSVEGPTPTSALFYGVVMVHAGVLLLARFAPVLDQAPAVAVLAGALAVLTAAHGLLAGLAQPDRKRQLALETLVASSAGVLLVALGRPGLGVALGAAAATLGLVRMLLAPSALAIRRLRPVGPPPLLARRARLQALARARFGVEARVDAVGRALLEGPARVVEAVEARLVAPVVGAAGEALDAVARMAERDDPSPPAVEAPPTGGVVARALGRVAAAAHAVESAVIGGLVGRELPRRGTAAGARLAGFEAFLQRPGVLLGAAAVTVLAVLGGWL